LVIFVVRRFCCRRWRATGIAIGNLCYCCEVDVHVEEEVLVFLRVEVLSLLFSFWTIFIFCLWVMFLNQKQEILHGHAWFDIFFPSATVNGRACCFFFFFFFQSVSKSTINLLSGNGMSQWYKWICRVRSCMVFSNECTIFFWIFFFPLIFPIWPLICLFFWVRARARRFVFRFVANWRNIRAT